MARFDFGAGVRDGFRSGSPSSMHEGTFGMFRRPFQRGDRVVYRKTKHSLHPGPRAQDVFPAPGGDDYSYCVDKYWTVTDLTDDRIVVITRRGKTHVLDKNDPNLRHARFWERWFLGDRFPEESVRSEETSSGSEATSRASSTTT
jgi:hypothetical protein